MARSDWSQDTAAGWMAVIWAAVTDGTNTWVWVVWSLVGLLVMCAVVCVVWVAVSTLWISPEALRRLQEAESASRYDGGPMGRVQNAARAGG